MGATGIIPGSQHWERYPASEAEHQEYLSNEHIAEMDRGDYLCFNPNVQHRGRENSTSDLTRKAGVYQFVMGGLQPMETPGAYVQSHIDAPNPDAFDSHYLRQIHSFPYPDDLAGKAGMPVNAEGAAARLRDTA